MKRKFRYKFELIESKGWFQGIGSPKMQTEYRRIVHQHSRAGWRLIQVFAPSFGAFGTVKYVELIFEQELEQEPE